ncbi:MAG: hypothetical protein ACI38A_03120 [Candidatus Ornithomonoglobus sp.]
MDHSTVRAVIVPIIIEKIMEYYHITAEEAYDEFYMSATGAALSDDETGLFGQSPNYIFGLYINEINSK